eukprot:m.127959 g.127959  ORF g.127959 m.127959 type:complete len:1258 (-) comp29308_c0_seq1:386-4159(-)
MQKGAPVTSDVNQTKFTTSAMSIQAQMFEHVKYPNSPKISRDFCTQSICSTANCSINKSEKVKRCRFCGKCFCTHCLKLRVRGLHACQLCYNAAPSSEKWGNPPTHKKTPDISLDSTNPPVPFPSPHATTTHVNSMTTPTDVFIVDVNTDNATSHPTLTSTSSASMSTAITTTCTPITTSTAPPNVTNVVVTSSAVPSTARIPKLPSIDVCDAYVSDSENSNLSTPTTDTIANNSLCAINSDDTTSPTETNRNQSVLPPLFSESSQLPAQSRTLLSPIMSPRALFSGLDEIHFSPPSTTTTTTTICMSKANPLLNQHPNNPSPIASATQRSNSPEKRVRARSFTAMFRTSPSRNRSSTISQPPELIDTLGFSIEGETHKKQRHAAEVRRRSSSTGSRARSNTVGGQRKTFQRKACRGDGPYDGLTIPTSTDQVRSFAWVGITSELRPDLWYHMSGAHLLKSATPQLYQQLCDEAPKTLSELSLRQVEMDVPRTFPNSHSRFRQDSKDCLLPQLKRILMAITMFLESQGRAYWQGFSFLAAFMLLIMDDEEQAFWSLRAMLRGCLAALFREEGPNPEVMLLDELVRERMPALVKHLTGFGIPVRTYTTQWVVCAFTTTLPPETVVRIWDFIILSSAQDKAIITRWPTINVLDETDTFSIPNIQQEIIGSNGLLLTSLTLLQIHQKEILRQKHPGEMNAIMKTSVALLYDVELLMDSVFALAGDEKIWRPEWTLHFEFQAIRQRVKRLLKLQDNRLGKFKHFKAIFMDVTQGNNGDGNSVRSKQRGIELAEFINFLRDLYVDKSNQSFQSSPRKISSQSQGSDIGRIDVDVSSSASEMSPTRPISVSPLPEFKTKLLRSATDQNVSAMISSPSIARRHTSGCTATAKDVFDTVDDQVWVAEAAALFQMTSKRKPNEINLQEFTEMAAAFPHILQHFSGEAIDRTMYSSTRLRLIFDRFDSLSRGVLSVSDLFNLVRCIHVRAAKLTGEGWASRASLIWLSQSEPPSIADAHAFEQHRQWNTEALAIANLCANKKFGFSFEDFLRCTVSHPTIAIGICIVQESDVAKRDLCEFIEVTELMEATHKFDDMVLIRRNDSSSSQATTTSVEDLTSSFLASSVGGDDDLLATIGAAKYVPSSSLMEKFVCRGSTQFKVKLINRVSGAVSAEKWCAHTDFIRLRDNLVEDYPKETRLSIDQLEQIRQLPIPARELTNFSPSDILARRNEWMHLLDVIQTIDSHRVRVCVIELVTTTTRTISTQKH